MWSLAHLSDGFSSAPRLGAHPTSPQDLCCVADRNRLLTKWPINQPFAAFSIPSSTALPIVYALFAPRSWSLSPTEVPGLFSRKIARIYPISLPDWYGRTPYWGAQNRLPAINHPTKDLVQPSVHIAIRNLSKI